MNLYAGLEGAKGASPSCHVVKYQQGQLLCMCQHFLACKLLLKSKELEYPSLSLQVRTSIIRQFQLKKSNQFLLYSIPSYIVSIDSSDISESSETIHPLIKKWSVNAWNSHKWCNTHCILIFALKTTDRSFPDVKLDGD